MVANCRGSWKAIVVEVRSAVANSIEALLERRHLFVQERLHKSRIALMLEVHSKW